jgi:hypothetical protein
MFHVPLKNFHLYGDVTITSEGLQNLGLCSTLRPFSREGSLSCHTCCDTGPRFFRSHPKDRTIQLPLTTHKGMWRIYSNPDRHGFWGNAFDGITWKKHCEVLLWPLVIYACIVSTYHCAYNEIGWSSNVHKTFHFPPPVFSCDHAM